MIWPWLLIGLLVIPGCLIILSRLRQPASAPGLTAADLARGLAEGRHFLLVDIRAPEEYAAGHLPGALNIPMEQLRTASFDPASDVVFY
jgi:3-mercaptopyruvate sulfurtransferase SseA